MSDGMAALFWGIVTFSILVVLHEGGHFLAARAFGVTVHEFMVGLPGPALRASGRRTDPMRPPTVYGVTVVPLGGYVRIAGMEPGAEDPLLSQALASVTRRGSSDAAELAADIGVDEARAEGLLLSLADWGAIVPEDDRRRYEVGRFRSLYQPQEAEDADALIGRARARTYRGLPTWKRIVVLSSGVLVNLMTAILVLSVVIGGWGIERFSLKLERVIDGSAAAQAGFRPGDTITRVGDKDVDDWQTLLFTLARYEPGDTVTVTYIRDGAPRTVTVVLGADPEGSGQAFLGVGPSIERVRPSPIGAVAHSFALIGMVFQAVGGFFDPDTFQATIEQSSGVIGVSYLAADAARSGPLPYAWLIALLSLSLGVMNILPIPPLDGGKVLMELIEKVIGHPVSRRVAIALSATGTLLLFVLIGYLMYTDVVKYVVAG